jgi:acyl-ACP thioesterase
VEALVPPPGEGRIYRSQRRVRLSEVDAAGRVRLDTVARYLQDVAIDDVDETGWGAPQHVWVVRWYRIEVLRPFLTDREVSLATWCSASASHAAGRRTSLHGDRGGRIEADSVWIHLDPGGRPARLDGFGIYTPSTEGRRASTRLALPDPPPEAPRMPWQLRSADVDRMGHVNNAVYWAALDARLATLDLDTAAEPYRVVLEFRRPLDLGDDLELLDEAGDGWARTAFAVGDDVRAVARIEVAAAVQRGPRAHTGLAGPADVE